MMIMFDSNAFPTVEACAAWLGAQLGDKAARLGALAAPAQRCTAYSPPAYMVRVLAEVQAGTAPDRRHLAGMKATELEQGVTLYE